MTRVMRAAVVSRYGPPDVVDVVDVDVRPPGHGEVLIRVGAVAVTSADARIRAARFPPGFGLLARLAFGLRKPRRKVLGSAYAGVVEAVGDGQTRFRPGDRATGMTGMAMGAHAEFVVTKADRATLLPTAVSDADAAGVLFGGTAALHFLRTKAKVGPGTTVLINGASGAIGTNAVQLAKLFGATVTAVTSTANADLARRLGADAVIDYTATPLESIFERFDVVFDTVGNLKVGSGKRLLANRGVLVLAVAGLVATLRARRNLVAGPAPERVAYFDELLAMVADGQLRVVHDREFTLDEIVKAHRLVDSGRKVGNVIVRPAPG